MSFTFHSPGGKARTRWEAWDEATQSHIASDNVFVTVFDGTSAGDNDTGAGGGLTGTDLVWTQSGTVAGASGGYRYLDGSNDYFSCTQTAAETMLTGQSSWTVALRVKMYNPLDTNSVIFQFLDASEILISAKNIAAATCTFGVYDDDNSQEDDTTSDSMAADGEYYIFFCCDGVQSKVGFHPVSSGKPSRFAQIDAGKKATHTNVMDNPGIVDGRRYIGTDTTTYFKGYVKWCILASECLLTL